MKNSCADRQLVARTNNALEEVTPPRVAVGSTKGGNSGTLMDSDMREWVKENHSLLEFLHKKISDYVTVEYNDFAEHLWKDGSSSNVKYEWGN